MVDQTVDQTVAFEALARRAKPPNIEPNHTNPISHTMVQHTNGVPPPDAGSPSLSLSLSSPEDDDAFPRPRPRPPPQRSPSQAAKVRVQNRRRAFLERNHHAYFASPEHELADPHRYDTLVRRFQTPAEREAAGRARGGWGKTLEASLLRGEARLGRLAASSSSLDTGDRKEEATTTTTRTNDDDDIDAADLVVLAAADEEEEEPETKEEGRRRWEAFLRERFVRGGDDDFDYAAVDGDEALDRMEDRDREEAWFDDEAPEWVDDDSSSDDDDEDNNGGGGTAGSKKRERVLQGQTGIQDY